MAVGSSNFVAIPTEVQLETSVEHSTECVIESADIVEPEVTPVVPEGEGEGEVADQEEEKHPESSATEDESSSPDMEDGTESSDSETSRKSEDIDLMDVDENEKFEKSSEEVHSISAAEPVGSDIQSQPNDDGEEKRSDNTSSLQLDPLEEKIDLEGSSAESVDEVLFHPHPLSHQMVSFLHVLRTFQISLRLKYFFQR